MEAIINTNSIGIVDDRKLEAVITIDNPNFEEVKKAVERKDFTAVKFFLGLKSCKDVNFYLSTNEDFDEYYFQGKKNGRHDAEQGLPYEDSESESRKYNRGYKNGYFSI